jgi:hypothetical protein
MNTLIGKMLCWINYCKKRNHTIKKYLSPQDFGVYCGIKDKWWYI